VKAIRTKSEIELSGLSAFFQSGNKEQVRPWITIAPKG